MELSKAADNIRDHVTLLEQTRNRLLTEYRRLQEYNSQLLASLSDTRASKASLNRKNDADEEEHAKRINKHLDTLKRELDDADRAFFEEKKIAKELESARTSMQYAQNPEIHDFEKLAEGLREEQKELQKRNQQLAAAIAQNHETLQKTESALAKGEKQTTEILSECTNFVGRLEELSFLNFIGEDKFSSTTLNLLDNVNKKVMAESSIKENNNNNVTRSKMSNLLHMNQKTISTDTDDIVSIYATSKGNKPNITMLKQKLLLIKTEKDEKCRRYRTLLLKIKESQSSDTIPAIKAVEEFNDLASVLVELKVHVSKLSVEAENLEKFIKMTERTLEREKGKRGY